MRVSTDPRIVVLLLFMNGGYDDRDGRLCLGSLQNDVYPWITVVAINSDSGRLIPALSSEAISGLQALQLSHTFDHGSALAPLAIGRIHASDCSSLVARMNERRDRSV
jgi:hypothetical protein